MTAQNMLDGATMTDEKISAVIDQWYFHSDSHDKAKLLRFARELLSASKPAGALSFEAWAMRDGLISESHGVRFVNSMCDVARKAWDAALAAGEEMQEAYLQYLDDTADATRPYGRLALIGSIAECQTLSYSEDRGITVSEAESIGAVLHELRRLQNIEVEAVAIVAREAAIVSPTGADDIRVMQAEIDRLTAVINTPHADDFWKAASIEAEHQRQRWGTAGDAGKTPPDWFWLVGYLAGKVLHAHAAGNTEKAEHHVITTAAALANWHRAMFGQTDMRPGIDGEASISRAEEPSHAEK